MGPNLLPLHPTPLLPAPIGFGVSDPAGAQLVGMVLMGQWLDLVILAFFSNLNDSMIDPEPRGGGGAGFVLKSSRWRIPCWGCLERG